MFLCKLETSVQLNLINIWLAIFRNVDYVFGFLNMAVLAICSLLGLFRRYFKFLNYNYKNYYKKRKPAVYYYLDFISIWGPPMPAVSCVKASRDQTLRSPSRSSRRDSCDACSCSSDKSKSSVLKKTLNIIMIKTNTRGYPHIVTVVLYNERYNY